MCVVSSEKQKPLKNPKTLDVNIKVLITQHMSLTGTVKSTTAVMEQRYSSSSLSHHASIKTGEHLVVQIAKYLKETNDAHSLPAGLHQNEHPLIAMVTLTWSMTQDGCWELGYSTVR